VASFTAPDTITLGQSVTMDASLSTPAPLTYTWTQLTGTPVTLTGAGTATATFTPTAEGAYQMQLIVANPTGLASVPVTRTITVTPAAPAVIANAGPDQTVTRGKVVTLDASATVGAQSLAWSQVSGPTMTLSSATASKPTFTYAFMGLPSATTNTLNTLYAPNNVPVVFRVAATPVGGGTPVTDTVTISPTAETFTTVVARFRTGRGEWRVTGNSSILSGQRITVVLGSTPQGRTIGSATVDAVGAFSIRAGNVPDPRTTPTAQTLVTVVSATGGLASFPLSVTR
jgi:PKD repeat protein